VHDPDPVAEAVRLVEDVGREDDREPSAGALREIVEDAVPGERVQAHGRLVEEEELHVVHQLSRDLEPPALAAGERPRLAVAEFAELEQGEHLLGTAFCQLPRDAP
jgi:hypothetical protein